MAYTKGALPFRTAPYQCSVVIGTATQKAKKTARQGDLYEFSKYSSTEPFYKMKTYKDRFLLPPEPCLQTAGLRYRVGPHVQIKDHVAVLCKLSKSVTREGNRGLLQTNHWAPTRRCDRRFWVKVRLGEGKSGNLRKYVGCRGTEPVIYTVGV